MGNKRNRVLAGVFCLAAFATPWAAQAQTAPAEVSIGFITTLSGPGGYLGQDARDGFMLAINEGGGKLGGVPVKLMVEDDGLKPAQGRQIAERFLKDDHVRLFTGTIFTNVAVAMLGDILDSGAYWLGPNTSPNEYAGKECDPHYFVTGWDETLHRSAGVLAKARGVKKFIGMAPNYETGRQVIGAIKDGYGPIAAEIYTSLDQTDFSAEIAKIRALAPDAMYEFEPGGLGINFLKQWQQAGLTDQIPLIVAAPSLDPRLLGAVGDAARNMHIAANWNGDLPNAANQHFVAAYEAAYHRTPTYYAANAYDTAQLIASALKASGGKLDDAFGAAVKKADFTSIRGHIEFASNNVVKQDWYELGVKKEADGKWQIVTERKISEMQGGAYADQCKMK
jgi:branched-chain amino acid transport system substrate-binding protein